MSTTEQPSPMREQLRQAGEQLRQAHDATVERIIGQETAGHLRQAARHVLQAGLAAIDAAEKRAKPTA